MDGGKEQGDGGEGARGGRTGAKVGKLGQGQASRSSPGIAHSPGRWLSCGTFPQLSGSSDNTIYCLTVLHVRSQNGFHQAEIKLWAGLCSLGASGESPFPAFSSSWGHRPPGLLAPSPLPKLAPWTRPFSCGLWGSLLLFMTLVGTLGSPK